MWTTNQIRNSGQARIVRVKPDTYIQGLESAPGRLQPPARHPEHRLRGLPGPRPSGERGEPQPVCTPVSSSVGVAGTSLPLSVKVTRGGPRAAAFPGWVPRGSARPQDPPPRRPAPRGQEGRTPRGEASPRRLWPGPTPLPPPACPPHPPPSSLVTAADREKGKRNF